MATRTALITGGTSGIGKATAELLRSRGYRVMVTGYGNVEGSGLPDDVVAIRADAGSMAEIDLAMSRVREHLGSLSLFQFDQPVRIRA